METWVAAHARSDGNEEEPTINGASETQVLTHTDKQVELLRLRTLTTRHVGLATS